MFTGLMWNPFFFADIGSLNGHFSRFCHLWHHYCDISAAAECVPRGCSVGCFRSPRLTLALCLAERSHSGFVPQRAGDENGCPLRNVRNFLFRAARPRRERARPKWVKSVRTLHCTICPEYPLAPKCLLDFEKWSFLLYQSHISEK